MALCLGCWTLRCGGPPLCTPGVSAQCFCTDGRSGAQVCGDDGRFASCVCEGNTAPDGASRDAAAAEQPQTEGPQGQEPTPDTQREAPSQEPAGEAPAQEPRQEQTQETVPPEAAGDAGAQEVAPEPTPQEVTPEPMPPDSPSCWPGAANNAGLTKAPLRPASGGNTVTVCAQGCTYSTLRSAIKAAKAGWIIQVKNGTYNVRDGTENLIAFADGTEKNPITLMAYPGHKPMIQSDPPGKHLLALYGDWWLVDGLHFSKCSSGLFVSGKHITIRNGSIRNNKGQGILLASTSQILIENNLIENNGTRESGFSIPCPYPPGANEPNPSTRPQQCHGIYISVNPQPSTKQCETTSHITIRRNILRNHGGRGVQFNNQSGCGSQWSSGGGKIEEVLIENNQIENNSVGVILFGWVEKTRILNNTFLLNKIPLTNERDHQFITIWFKSINNIIMNNIFYSKLPANPVAEFVPYPGNKIVAQYTHVFQPIKLSNLSPDWRSSSNPATLFDHNLWYTPGLGAGWSSTHKKYNWLQNTTCCTTDPKFTNTSAQNYRLQPSSPAIDKGVTSKTLFGKQDKALCAHNDIDGDKRPQGACDLGMDEANALPLCKP